MATLDRVSWRSRELRRLYSCRWPGMRDPSSRFDRRPAATAFRFRFRAFWPATASPSTGSAPLLTAVGPRSTHSSDAGVPRPPRRRDALDGGGRTAPAGEKMVAAAVVEVQVCVDDDVDAGEVEPARR